MAKVSLKEVLSSDLWIITKVKQGSKKTVRVDAKRRFPVADQSSFYSEWVKQSTIKRYIGKELKITEY